MTPAERKKALRKFSDALDESPLKPDSPYYVRELHLYNHDGLQIDLVANLADEIERKRGGRQAWLFTGNLGSGKSTELLRLQNILSQQGIIALVADAQDHININQPVEIGDFLISLTAAFAEQAGSYLNDALLARSYWERIRDFLQRTNVEATAAKLKINLLGLEGDLNASLQTDPTTKELIQEHVRGLIATLADELEAFRDTVLARLRGQHPECKVVLILDSLERMRGSGKASDKVFSSLRDMFEQFADRLRFKDIQVVYSVPPYLPRLSQQLAGVFGIGALCHLTTTHIFKERSREPDPAGLAVVREIISRRYAAWEKFLSVEQLDAVIIQSGGDLRDLLRLLKIILPLLEKSENVDAVLNYAFEQVRRDMVWIEAPDLERLAFIAQHKQERNLPGDLDGLVRDLEVKRVLMYRNGSEWYDVHPLLREFVAERGGLVK